MIWFWAFAQFKYILIFFLGKQPRREAHALFCLELYQEIFTISENHITDSSATVVFDGQ